MLVILLILCAWGVRSEIKQIRLCAKNLVDIYNMDEKQSCTHRSFINSILEKYEITNMWRLLFLMAQVGHLSESMTIFEEQTDGSQYENKPELCNTKSGDGQKYKKRGAGIMILGKCEYAKFSQSYGHYDFVKYYWLVGDIYTSMIASTWKWYDLGLSSIADEVYLHPNQDVYEIFDKTTRILTDGEDATSQEIADGRFWLQKVFNMIFDRCYVPGLGRRSSGVVKCDDPQDIFCGLSCPADGYEGECAQFE